MIRLYEDNSLVPDLNFEQKWTNTPSRLIILRSNDREVQILAIAVSALFHIVLFFIVYLNFTGLFSKETESLTEKVLEVELLPELFSKKKQIVSESEKVNQIKSEQAFKEAEQNNSILEESVKRGDGGKPIAKTITKPVTIQKDPSPKTTPKEKPAKQVVEKTKPKTNEPGNKIVPEIKLEKTTSASDASEEKIDLQTKTQNNLNSALAGNLFAGQGGSPDLLPNVREGEITLLNTKASKYAVFVRRVALQVFNELKNRAWKQLNFEEIQSIIGNATVIAKLDPKGNLLSAQLISNSGSKIFNDLIYLAVKDKARDPHPPESALVDGQFHFVFQTKMTSAMSPGRNGGYSERRWLVLSVGLE